MTCYTEFCECYKHDDCERLPGLVEKYSILPAVTAAAAYSGRQQKIGPRMTRAILRSVLAELELLYAIWVLDELINGDNHHTEKAMGMQDTKLDEVARGHNRIAIDEIAFQMVRREVLTPPDQRYGQEIEQNRRQLIEYIGTCDEPAFCRYLHFINETDAVVVLPSSIILATLERAKRTLKDDRAFFLTIRSALIEAVFDQTLAATEATQAELVRQLAEQGYRIEPVPGMTNAFMARSPKNAGSSDNWGMADTEDTAFGWGAPTSNPNSGINWAANHSRKRGNNRRRC